MSRYVGEIPSIQEVVMRIASIVIVIWLVIGAAAATQRDYFKSTDNNCRKTSDTILTIAAGPLNYLGVNPKVSCKLPQPSS
jgi:cell division protein YceG involved in septum cleavage